MNIDFTKQAEEFELNHDFLDNPENGGGKGNGKNRRVNMIKKAMQIGANAGIVCGIDLTVKRFQKEMADIKIKRIISNGHEDSFK